MEGIPFDEACESLAFAPSGFEDPALGIENATYPRPNIITRESVINGLRPYIDVVVIGDTTCGKPVGMRGYDLFDMHISPIEFTGLNADGEGAYYDGIEPICHSEDDVTRQFGETQEDSLMKALNYLQSCSCTSGALTSGIMKVKGPQKEVPMSGFRREIGVESFYQFFANRGNRPRHDQRK